MRTAPSYRHRAAPQKYRCSRVGYLDSTAQAWAVFVIAGAQTLFGLFLMIWTYTLPSRMFRMKNHYHTVRYIPQKNIYTFLSHVEFVVCLFFHLCECWVTSPPGNKCDTCDILLLRMKHCELFEWELADIYLRNSSNFYIQMDWTISSHRVPGKLLVTCTRRGWD